MDTDFDLEDNVTDLGFALKFAGRRKLSPEFGWHNGKPLVGVQYLVLGTRSELKRLYGGPGVIWYDDKWGPSLTLGTHLTREWIVEGSLRWTSEWDGAATVAVARGFNLPFLGR